MGTLWVTLGRLCGDFGVTLGSLWGHFGVTLWSLWAVWTLVWPFPSCWVQMHRRWLQLLTAARLDLHPAIASECRLHGQAILTGPLWSQKSLENRFKKQNTRGWRRAVAFLKNAVLRNAEGTLARVDAASCGTGALYCHSKKYFRAELEIISEVLFPC